MNVGSTIETSKKSIALAEQYEDVYAAIGVHPSEIGCLSEEGMEWLRERSAHPKVVAIGEIGLDYYWLKTPEERANSRDFFDAQLSLAEELNLPAIVHDRDAHRDCLDIVRAHPGSVGCSTAIPAAWRTPRCWWTRLDALLHRQHHLQERPPGPRHPPLAAPGPADAGDRRPYMAPEPYRGQRCDSTMIARSAETVAQLRGLTRDEVEAVTLENGKKFFGIA